MICALLFFAATINYVDRQVIGILKPTLQQEFGWSEIDYGDIIFAFQLAYAIGFLLAGRMIDWLGTKKGFTVALVVWSLAAMAHAEATVFGPTAAAILQLVGLTYTASVAGFIFARLALGFGEAGNFPAAIKVTAEWFPKKERALATGIFNSGTNIGALVTPLVVPWITLYWGWYWAFVITGRPRLHLVVLLDSALPAPEEHPSVGAAELAHIRSDPPDPPAQIPWVRLLRYRQTWAFALGKFLTDPVWWLYLFWIPDFLNRNHGIDLSTIGPPLVAIYLIADVGSIGGGWLSSTLAQARMERQRGPEDGDAGVRARGPADGVCVACHATVGRGRARQPRGLRPPGLVRESFHVDVGHVPAPGRRLGRRPRRLCRRRRRDADCQDHRVHPASDRKLHADLLHRRVRLPRRHCSSSTCSCHEWSR